MLLNSDKFPNKKIIEYFLEKVFIPNVMKGPLVFNNSDLIENTRISICQYLIENQLGDKNNLQQEIKRRSKSLVLKDAKLHIENTKIYVDIDYVKSKVNKECRQLFDNYIVLLNEDYSTSKDEYELNKAINAFNNIEEKTPELQGIHLYIFLRNAHLVNLNLNEKNKLFMSLLRKIRDEFIHGIKGLNGYLSTRIRHGTLETHFRKALLDDKLLQNSLNTSVEFEWTNRLHNNTCSNSLKIDLLLKEFSLSFDSTINMVIDDWLQVSIIDLDLLTLKETKKEALFNYSISNMLSFELQKKIDKASNYEDFWDAILDWLWITTDQNLVEVQRKFENDLLPKFKTCFDKLQEGLILLQQENNLNISELLTAIASSRQKLMTSVKESTRWFSRNTDIKETNYDFEIALEIVQRSLSTKSINYIGNNLTIPGNHLSYYVDIIYILYANAIKHSHLEKDNVSIECTINKLDNAFEIIILNICGEVKNFKSINKHLRKYNDIYTTDKSLDKLRKEGGTGFYKVQKIIKEDITSEIICDIKYLNETSFQVRLEIK